MKGKLVGLAATAALATGLLSGAALAFPADKASVMSTALVIKHFADDDGNNPGSSNVTLLGPIKYKTSTPGDVIATFHTECLLMTRSRTLASTKEGEAGATMNVGIQIAPDDDGEPGAWSWVAISANDNGSNADVGEFGTFLGPDPGVGRVTMCGRWQRVSYRFDNLESDPDDFIEVWTNTRQTHGFQWPIVNPAQATGGNTFWIRVQGLVDSVATLNSESGVAAAKRILTLTPVKLHQVLTDDSGTGCYGDCPVP